MKTILLADDEDDIRQTLKHFLERRGMRVFEAKDGPEALNLYKTHTPDCVLLDMKLPLMDGLEVFQKIKQINPSAKIYFLSGIADTTLKDTAKSVSADGYLSKPIVLEDIVKIIESI
jgi:two-component system response regulator (stage 0 sporulation protein F)